jgi:hypothetical protein
MGAYLARMLVVLGPGLALNEEMGLLAAAIWVTACTMILVSLPQDSWIRR